MGKTYLNLEEYKQALEYSQKSLAIRIKDGENNPSVANSCAMIGDSYNHLFNFKKALEYHQRALAIEIFLFGENHKQVAGSYFVIGVAHQNM
jgi:tetratricopeptide (TPR) repeat protein